MNYYVQYENEIRKIMILSNLNFQRKQTGTLMEAYNFSQRNYFGPFFICTIH